MVRPVTTPVGRLPLVGLLVFAVLAVACTSTRPASPTPSPTPGVPLTQAELKVRLVEAFGPLWFCDPDFFPVARADEAALAKQHFSDVQADSEALAAILAATGLPGGNLTDDQKLAVYRYWKQLRAIVLDPAEVAGIYQFDYLNMPAPNASVGRRTTGTIDAEGAITVEQQAPAGQPNCPICLARGTRIATPDGQVAIEDVRVGTHVWSIDGSGRRFVATVLLVGRTRVPATHEVVRLVLDDGRILRASPGHPLPDGRALGTIRPGDRVDGASVVSATREAYDGGFTFDLVPDGPTGFYIADGVPLASTLVRR